MLIAEASQVRRGGGVLIVSCIGAAFLSLVPLPAIAEAWRPAFLPLVVVYWCMNVPGRIGVLAAWLTGLGVDLLVGALLGQHALALAIVAYFTLKFRRRLLVAPAWQLAFSVLVLVFIYQALLLWISSLQGLTPVSMHYWSMPLASVIAWPAVLSVLRELRLRYRIN